MKSPTQMTPEQIVYMNSQMRAMMLRTAIPQEKNLGTFTETALGRTTRIKLYNVGVITKLILDVTAAVTIGTAIATPSTKAPWNLITRIRVTDYDGTDRVNVSGFQLFLINCRRKRRYFGFNNSASTSVYTNPSVPTAVATANIQFQIEVPLAYDVDNPIVELRDLRGAIMAQTAVGEAYLNIDWATTLYTNNDVDAVYSGGATSTVVLAAAGIQTTVFQHFLLQQAVGAGGQIPMPNIDFMTVYELAGNQRTSDNIAQNTDKNISYPNLRQVLASYLSYVSGAALVAGRVDQFRLVANGNNNIFERTERAQLFYQRQMTDGDLLPASYIFDHTAKPIETALYGNVQLVARPINVPVTPYMELGFESMWTKGQALPGVLNS
jgi:hypothetical protein